LAMPPQTLK